MWYVVYFDKENAVEAVPSSWYVESSKECIWPPKATNKRTIIEHIKYQSSPGCDWEPHKAEILGKYDSYSRAEFKAIKAKRTNTLSSDDCTRGRGMRTKKHNKKYNSSSQEDSDYSDSYPKPPKRSNDNYLSESSFREEPLSPRYSYPKPPKHSNNTHLRDPSFREETSSPRAVQVLGADQVPEVVWISGSANPSQESVFCENNPKPPSLARPAQTLGAGQMPRVVRTPRPANETYEQVLRELSIINIKLCDLAENIDFIMVNITRRNAGVDQVSQGDQLLAVYNVMPVTTATLPQMEEMLKEEETKKLLAKDLSRVGGKTVKDITRRLMYKVFTNELGAQYSWEGAKGKKCFKNLTIASVIISAVRLNAATSEASDYEVINIIKAWLVRAKDRLNKREPVNEPE